ncbi:MAG TPA: alpha/beta hydrolase [Acidobacteriota bacterium]|nr:alpha/beta hydrolase [Acidobacteriota bacterium]
MRFVHTHTSDSLILQGLLCEPVTQTKSAILHIHGMAGNFWENSFVKTMIEQYPRAGVSFLTVETRGSEVLRWFSCTDGSQRLIGNSYERFEDCVLDIDAWVSFLVSLGYDTIYLQGHSLGCAKIAYYMKGKQPVAIKGLLLISPSDMLGLLEEPSYHVRYEALLGRAKSLINEGKPDELLALHWDFAHLSARTFVNFSSENDNIAIFNYLNPRRGFATLNALTVPVLAIMGTKDDGIVHNNVAAAVDLLRKNIRTRFVGAVFTDAAHDFNGFEDRIVSEVLDFIK